MDKSINAAPQLPLLALMYRAKTGCRQYPFYSIEDLETWGNRHPYVQKWCM